MKYLFILLLITVPVLQCNEDVKSNCTIFWQQDQEVYWFDTYSYSIDWSARVVIATVRKPICPLWDYKKYPINSVIRVPFPCVIVDSKVRRVN